MKYYNEMTTHVAINTHKEPVDVLLVGENKVKEAEIKIMYSEFWDKNSSFHNLRREFVYKICPTKTPTRLKVYNT